MGLRHLVQAQTHRHTHTHIHAEMQADEHADADMHAYLHTDLEIAFGEREMGHLLTLVISDSNCRVDKSCQTYE